MKNFKLKRVWVEAPLYKEAIIKITSKEKRRHLNTVLKIKLKENLRVFNQTYGEWFGQVQEINKKEIAIKIKEYLRKTKIKSKIDITIAFAPIKPDRLKFLIEKSTEIGADKFVPVITERTIIRSIKREKLYNYALGASEQSERLSIPEIKEIISLKDFIKTYNVDSILFCSERSNSGPINRALQKLSKIHQLTILIGPEGGFSATEQKLLTSQKNIYPVSLGKNILRSETAVVFALSCIISNKTSLI